MWTDVAANAVVGTKGLMGARLYADADIAKRALDPFSSARKSQSITVFKRRVRYHWPFAVPAFIVLLALVTAPLSALIICSTHKFGLASLRAALHKTSVGRILADALYPEEAPPNADTVAWIQSVGTRAVDYSGQYPVRGKKVGGLPEIVPQNGGAVPEEQHFLAKEDRSASRLD